MIEQSASPTPDAIFEFRLRPERPITASGLAVFFMVLVAVSVTVAGFSALQGNVFAPAFAALELTLVWVALRLVWRRQDQCQERIALNRDALTLARQPSGDEVRFHPYWVRVWRAPAGGRSGRRPLMLASHGRAVEVGAFLGDDERGRLEGLLAGALEALRADRNAGSERKAPG